MSEYNLERFITAQNSFFEQALSEIKSGHKRSHWMWYIFPQLRALGISDRALKYGIIGLGEAKAYMQNPYLRENLTAISRALLELETNNAFIVMGSTTDAIKLCSCMTLFEAAAPDVSEFSKVLEKYYNGVRDERTLKLLEIN